VDVEEAERRLGRQADLCRVAEPGHRLGSRRTVRAGLGLHGWLGRQRVNGGGGVRAASDHLLASYRNHTLRAEGKHGMPWRHLMESLGSAVHKVNRALIENLRQRRPLRGQTRTVASASGI